MSSLRGASPLPAFLIAAILQLMPDTQSEATGRIAQLDREDCVRLLSATSVGRLAVSASGPGTPPVIRPVNYVFETSSQSVVFRSARGSKFTALLCRARRRSRSTGAILGPRAGGA
jgi:hypothetical protein